MAAIGQTLPNAIEASLPAERPQAHDSACTPPRAERAPASTKATREQALWQSEVVNILQHAPTFEPAVRLMLRDVLISFSTDPTLEASSRRDVQRMIETLGLPHLVSGRVGAAS